MPILSGLVQVLIEIVEYLAVLITIIFVHEFGHFIVGRWCGVKVDAFSIGFGPELFGFYDRKGTRWRAALIPFGGYVKFFGDPNAASTQDPNALAGLTPAERAVSLGGQSLAKRAAIVAAGPIFNFLLAFVIFAGLLYVNGRYVMTPRVGEVIANSAAAQAGLQSGDIVKSIDGEKVETFSDMVQIVSLSSGVPLKFVVERAGAPVTLTVTPRTEEVDSPVGKQHAGRIGVKASQDEADMHHVEYNIVQAMGGGASDTVGVVTGSVAGIRAMISGRVGTDQISGPVEIATATGNIARNFGFGGLLALIAILSSSVGFANLLPIPILDGGHLMFFGLEAIKRAPLSQRFQERGTMVGALIIACLIFFVIFNSLHRYVMK
ncbi:M50 family metallopeptidase [Methylovirgula sp. 4M-Z18]|uniref:M50 family metallopeptidase n=1 Tax=Methylovirgula sp. 4M-Z18 TaxID=2293567 RepID=UPI000E2F524B|nr:M50 family metallopeptidase [Methylovirgula sp. 4M-Z18]RFB80218.1 RIP metalloprotease [Methylovirgula sp. 4M-Z18]